MTQSRTFQQKFSIARETTWGTGVNPTVTFPITDGDLVPQITATFDDGRRGVPTADFEALLDAGHSEINMEGWAYPNTIGHFLYGLFGADTITGAGDPYEHEFALATDTPSYTIEEILYGGTLGSLRATGCRVGSMRFNWESNQGALMWGAQLMGKLPTIVTAASTSITAEEAWEGWRATITSTGIGCTVLSGEINLNRDLQVVHTGCDTRDPSFINVGPMRVEGNLLVAFTDMAMYELYLDATRQPLSIVFDKSATPDRIIEFTMNDAFFSAAPIEVDRSNIGQALRLSYRGIYNSTDSGNVRVILTNGQASYAA